MSEDRFILIDIFSKFHNVYGGLSLNSLWSINPESGIYPHTPYLIINITIIEGVSAS